MHIVRENDTLFAGVPVQLGSIYFLDLNIASSRDRRSIGDHRRTAVARKCGQHCLYKLHNTQSTADNALTELVINLTRWTLPPLVSNNTQGKQKKQQWDVIPIVQYLDTDNATRARVSTADESALCLYSAQVQESNTTTILNLCDGDGGLVSWLLVVI